MTGWKPIETAPEGEPHIRGMWVFCAHTKKPKYFEANVGYVDDGGDFVDMDGNDDFGWRADDYDWWWPLPMPLPEPPKTDSKPQRFDEYGNYGENNPPLPDTPK